MTVIGELGPYKVNRTPIASSGAFRLLATQNTDGVQNRRPLARQQDQSGIKQTFCRNLLAVIPAENKIETFLRPGD